MKLDVTRALRSPGQSFPFQAVQTIAPQEINGDIITLDDARLEGTLMADEDGNVTVDGTLDSVAHSRCAHCLAPASSRIHAEFRETFLRDGDPDDTEIFVYSGSRLDFERLAMCYAVMEIPMRFLCREDCMGFGGFEVVDDVRHSEDGDEYSGIQTQPNPFGALEALRDQLPEDDSEQS